jgi:hypothetical protein
MKCRKCGKDLKLPGPATSPCDVFISYSAVDKNLAHAICNHLESGKIRCWIAPRDIVPGVEWGEAILDGIGRARVMVLVFSRNSNESPQVRREVERAVNKGIPLIPFRVEDLLPSRSLEYFLSSCHWLDAMAPPVEQHLDRLSEAILTLLNRKSTAPARKAARPAPAPAPQPVQYAPAAPPAQKSSVLSKLGVFAFLLAALGGLGAFFWFIGPRLLKELNEVVNTATEPGGPARPAEVASAGTGSSNGENAGEVVPGGDDSGGSDPDRNPPGGNDSIGEDAGGGVIAPPIPDGGDRATPVEPAEPPEMPPRVSTDPGTPPEEPRGPGLLTTAAYRQDFKGVKAGELPEGWSGDDTVRVITGGDLPPRVEGSATGQHYVTVAGLTLGTQFFLEVDLEMGFGHRLELTLEGSRGGRDLMVAAMGDQYVTTVEAPQSEPRQAAEVVVLARGKFRVERDGNIYRTLLNGRLVHAHRIGGFRGFGSLKIGITGGPEYAGAMTRVYVLEAGPLDSADVPQGLPPGSAPLASLQENFKGAATGGLPAGWKGDDCIGMFNTSDHGVRLEVSDSGEHSLESPRVRIGGDFSVEADFELGFGQKLGLTLVGAGGKPDLTVNVSGDQYGSQISLAGADDKQLDAVAVSVRARLRIEREGKVVRVFLEGKLAHAQPFPDYGDFQAVRFALFGGGDTNVRTRLYTVEVEPIESGASGS